MDFFCGDFEGETNIEMNALVVTFGCDYSHKTLGINFLTTHLNFININISSVTQSFSKLIIKNT